METVTNPPASFKVVDLVESPSMFFQSDDNQEILSNAYSNYLLGTTSDTTSSIRWITDGRSVTGYGGSGGSGNITYSRTPMTVTSDWTAATTAYTVYANALDVTSTSSTQWNITYNGNTYTHAGYGTYYLQQETPAVQLKQIIQNNLSPEQRRRQRYLDLVKTPEELKARETLRDMILEQDWRRYVTNGFLMVKGPSGNFYQVFADQSRTQIYREGKKIGSLCIHTDRECPPTDHVINLKLLIEYDEPALWRASNTTQYGNGLTIDSSYSLGVVSTPVNLVDAWQSARRTS
jgi:hypothetical protein